MKLSYKIFGSFLLTIILSLFLMVTILRIHAAISFSDFINDRLMEKMVNLKEKLIVEYNRNNSWEFLRSEPHPFRSLVEQSIDKRERFRRESGIFHQKHRPMPPEHGFARRPNPQEDDFPEPGHGKGGMMPPPMMGPQDLIDRISLFDENKNPVVGRSKNHSKNTLGAITVNGKIIGYLGIDKDRQLFEPRETGFLKQQFKAFTFIGCGVLFLSALVSFVLSKHMLSPIKGLIKSTQDVASFKFDTRIDIKTNDELGRLASDFNSMAMTLEKYEDLRKQWISDISHELRTPLSVLQAEVEALEDGVRELNHEALASLHGEISHLTKIVNDLHDLSLSDSGMLYFRMEPVNPVEILVETLQLFKTTCEKQTITLVQHLKIEPGSMITGDKDRLVQMFSNIIENGIKYMTKPGQLTIRQKVFHNRLVLSFEDSGPGVPEESLVRLFDRFYRLDSSRSRKKGGSGLGLSICKNIAETMGGIISARNTTQGGLGIDIDLPLEARGNKLQ
ncbi:MAG: ATP-binding protein [Desulfobacteraceae bacterium]|jgi:two-component system sensor histidine kinase BaeS